MKKLLSVLIGILLSVSFYGQTGADCTNAIPFPNTNSCINNNTLSGSELWYSFVADNTSQNITLKLRSGSLGHIHTMELIGGVCYTGLAKIDSVSITSGNDTILVLTDTNLVVGNTYFIRARKDNMGCPKCQITANFDLCLAPLTPTFPPCVSTDGGLTFICCPTGVSCLFATICVGASIDLAALDNMGNYVTAGYTFTAAGGTLSGSSVTYSSPGTYTVCVGIGMALECGTVVVLPPPVITVNSPSICVGQTSVLNASGAGAGGTYSWSTGATGSSISVTPPLGTTSYTVTGTNAGGCTGTAVATVTVNPIPVVTVNSPTICAGATATLTAAGATTYSWSTGAITNPITVSPASTTSYTVTGTSLGCSSTAVSTVTVKPLPVVTVNSPSICIGASAILTAAGATTYSWSTGAVTNLITVTPAATTTYTVTGTSLGCTASAVSTVTVNPALVVTVNSPTICIGASAILTAVGATTYSWSTGAITNPITVSPIATTSYTVTGTAGCSGTAVATVTVNNPAATSLPSSFTVCNGATVPTTSFGPAGSTFAWTNSNTSIGLGSGATGNVPSFTATNGGLASISGTISVTTTDASGCSGTPLTYTITVDPTPNVTATPSSATICSGTATSIAFTSTVTGTTFNWTVVQTNVSGAAAGSGTSITQTLTATATTAGTAVYTITPTIGGICPGTPITVTITVNPTPVATATPASATICSGATTGIALTSPVAGTTFNWVVTQVGVTGATAGSGSSIAQVLTATTPSSGTATYTITPIAAGCPGAPITVTITVNPISVVTPFSQVFCSGSSTAIIAPSGVTYTWTVVQTNVTGASAGSGSSITQVLTTTTPGVTGNAVYTITPSIGGCIGATVTVTVIVHPNPIVIITPATIIIPLGGSAVLTASGASGPYSWSTGALFNPITVSPTTTTTYTVTGTNQDGCSATATATVTVVNYPCAITPPISPLPPTSPTSGGTIADGATSFGLFGPGTVTLTGNFIVVGSFIINTNVQTIGCNFVMTQALGAGSTIPNIKVTSGKTLNLSQNTHIYSCTTMWDGIYVSSGCSIICQNNVIIEDAIQAINILPGAKLPAIPGGCSITQTILNKDLFGIKLLANPAPSTPIDVTNSIFTCRQLIFTSAAPGGMPSVATTKPILATANPSLTLAPVNLLPPNAGRKTFVGVYADDVRSLTVGDASTTPPAPPATRNVFDAIMTGIDIVNTTKPNTTANIYHNNFQFILGVAVLPCFSFPPPPPGTICPYSAGYGILASGMNNTASNIINVGGTSAQGNTFRNIYKDVSITNYQTVTVQRNSVTNISTGPFPPGVVNYGDQGIYVAPAQNSNVNISDQVQIKNCLTAIWVNHFAGVTTGLSLLRINNNGTSTASPGITSDGIPIVGATPGAICNNGIYVTDQISANTPHALWQIRNNFITETGNCIYLTNVKRPGAGFGSTTIYDMFSNSCNAFYANTGILAGIRTSGCKGISITENHTNFTPGSAAYVFPTGNLTAYGLYLQQSQNMFVGCNLFEDAGRSMVFEGNCTSTPLPNFGITQNTMRRAQDGFVLKNNGIIGTQSNASLTAASNNYWDMSAGGAPNFTNSEVFTDNTGGAPSNANVFSKLYMNNNTALVFNSTMPRTPPAFIPGLSFSNVGVTNAYTLGTGLNVTSVTPTGCTGTPPPALVVMSPTDIVAQAAFLQTVQSDSTLLPIYDNETHWQLKKYVFDEVDDNPAYIVNPSLASFYTAHTGSAFDKFARVDRQIALGHYAIADAINNSITPSNIVESNQQTVNTQILLQLLTPGYIYTPSDISTLYSIANQCPLQGGNGVYQARILLMTIANDVIEFIDNCDKVPQKLMNVNPQSITNEEVIAYKLYPNPNDGNMIFEYSLSETSKGMFMLYDVTGRLINSYKLTEGENITLKINENELQNGIYFYNVIIDNKIKAHSKIVIVK